MDIRCASTGWLRLPNIAACEDPVIRADESLYRVEQQGRAAASRAQS
jgi:hypothetical protein